MAPGHSYEKELNEDTPCHSLACAIQDCLKKNNYDQQKCKSQVNALYECCNSFYAQKGEQATSVSCPKAALLRIKMKQMADGNPEGSKW